MNQVVNDNPDVLLQEFYFPSPVYWIDKHEVLDEIKKSSEDHLYHKKNSVDFEVNEIYPFIMSNQLHGDQRFHELIQYVAQTSWNILDSQGFDMSNLMTTVKDAWVQEHQTHSGHEEHVHNLGCQISAFYILEVPEKGSNFFISDPRPGKRQIDLISNQEQVLKLSDSRVHFNLKPGMLYFTNSWLPHGFTKNASKTSFKFIHFNVGVAFIQADTGKTCNNISLEII